MIGFDAVSFLYSGSAGGIHDFSHTFPSGKMTGVFGPNGAGKSTILKLLLRLAGPYSGTIQLAGQAHAAISDRELAKLCAWVSPFACPPVDVTVLEILAAGRYPYVGWWGELYRSDRDVMDRYVSELGLNGWLDRSMFSLSSGQQQLVHLARALIQEPKILLLDEPLIHLDLQHQILFLTYLRQKAAEGITVIVASHHLNELLPVCDELLFLKDQRLVATGKSADVLTESLIQRVFDVDARVDVLADGRFFVRL